MAGGGVVPPFLAAGEKLWRMIEPGWYQAGALQEATFIGEVSLVRAAYVKEAEVDAAQDPSGAFRFAKHGILELDADLMTRATGCSFSITPDYLWPLNTHVIILRSSGGKRLKAGHSEVADLTDLANDSGSSHFVRLPRP